MKNGHLDRWPKASAGKGDAIIPLHPAIHLKLRVNAAACAPRSKLRKLLFTVTPQFSGPLTRLLLLAGLVWTSWTAAVQAQPANIPDANLQAAIRQALQKPMGPLLEQDLLSLTNLDACCRNIHNAKGLEAARSLRQLDLSTNPLTNFFLPDGLTNLTSLGLESTGLTNLSLPTGLSSLLFLELGGNQLTNLVLHSDMRNLNVLGLELDHLTELILPPGLTNLNVLALQQNELTSFTVPPDATRLANVQLGGNPLENFIVPETAATNFLANVVATLQSDGIQVFTYPLLPRLIRPRRLIGAFDLAVAGPPGPYSVWSSTNLTSWSQAGVLTNKFGHATFRDVDSSPAKFYQLRTL